MATHPEIIADLAGEYYQWSGKNPEANYKDFPKYNEVRALGEELYKTGGKKLMSNAYKVAQMINPNQVWIISKLWDRIGNPYGDLDDIWLD